MCIIAKQAHALHRLNFAYQYLPCSLDEHNASNLNRVCGPGLGYKVTLGQE